jgi:hypothetical protein
MHKEPAVGWHRRSVGLSLKELNCSSPDPEKIPECCGACGRQWSGSRALVDAIRDLPDKSRAILFQRMLTIVYVAPESRSELRTPISRSTACVWHLPNWHTRAAVSLQNTGGSLGNRLAAAGSRTVTSGSLSPVLRGARRL